MFVNDASLKLNSRTLPVVGITGSYSKTTTKNVLNQILQVKNKTFVTPESYNNRLGIAKAINENFQNVIDYYIEYCNDNDNVKTIYSDYNFFIYNVP